MSHTPVQAISKSGRAYERSGTDQREAHVACVCHPCCAFICVHAHVVIGVSDACVHVALFFGDGCVFGQGCWSPSREESCTAVFRADPPAQVSIAFSIVVSESHDGGRRLTCIACNALTCWTV